MFSKKFFRIFTLSSLIFFPSFSFCQNKPERPTTKIEELGTATVVAACIDCEVRFSTKNHNEIVSGLLKNKYVKSLRKALYIQDSLHQFQSKVHFDNCDFQAAKIYIDELLQVVDLHVKKATKAKNLKRASLKEEELQRAFFALGQALHGVQDFYAHSNYVEISTPKVKRMVEIPVLHFWHTKNEEQLQLLIENGLISGSVIWGIPKRCPEGAPTHGDLAKDSEKTPSGKKRLENLDGVTQFQVAHSLARQASLDFIRDAFVRWPLMREANGSDMAFEIFIDRRGL